MSKKINFSARCPKCEILNQFILTKEEVQNDYDMSCDCCETQYPIATWRGRAETECVVCKENIKDLQDENAVEYKGKKGFMCKKCFTK